MNVVIVGGGEIGRYLGKTLDEEGNYVSIVEINEKRSKELAQELDVLVINGDGTQIDVLKDAKVMDADVLVAATDDDDANLVASQLGKKEFDLPQTIARVNNSDKKALFDKVGIDTSITVTDAAALSFKNEIKSEPFRTLFSYTNKNIELNEFKVVENSKIRGNSLKNIDLPKNSVIVSIVREDDIVFPKGDSVFKEGDRVHVLMYSKDVDKIEEIFLNFSEEK